MGLLCQNSINISLCCLPKVGRVENLFVHLFNISSKLFKSFLFNILDRVKMIHKFNYHFVLWTGILTRL